MDQNDDVPVTEPPPLGSISTIATIGACGCAAPLVASVLGLMDSTSRETIETTRVLLSVLGLLVSGCALSMRPRWFGGWLIMSATCFVAAFGFPAESWYTFRFAAFVFSGVAAIGALLAALPYTYRCVVGGAIAMIHFGGILTAVLSPPPAPELVNQLWVVVYRPYLQFAYLNNAYQFYSPDPGPANEIWFCIEYESKPDDPVAMEALQLDEAGNPVRDRVRGQVVYSLIVDENGEPKGERINDAQGNFIFTTEKVKGHDKVRPLYYSTPDEPEAKPKPRYVKIHTWYKMPRRPRDVRDPLGQTYYRRLSLTEYVSQGSPLSALPATVQKAITDRRVTMTRESAQLPPDKEPIPLTDTGYSIEKQFILPSDQIQDLLLPSYVRHIAKQHQRPDRAIAGIKVYRVLHEIIRIDWFVGQEMDGKRYPWHPYDPSSYLPYYVGDFDQNGKLRDLKDPMLYWLLPITRRADRTLKDYEQPLKKMKFAEYKRLYIDYVAVHAGSHHMEGELEK